MARQALLHFMTLFIKGKAKCLGTAWSVPQRCVVLVQNVQACVCVTQQAQQHRQHQQMAFALQPVKERGGGRGTRKGKEQKQKKAMKWQGGGEQPKREERNGKQARR